MHSPAPLNSAGPSVTILAVTPGGSESAPCACATTGTTINRTAANARHRGLHYGATGDRPDPQSPASHRHGTPPVARSAAALEVSHGGRLAAAETNGADQRHAAGTARDGRGTYRDLFRTAGRSEYSGYILGAGIEIPIPIPKQELGWSPPVTPREAITRTARWVPGAARGMTPEPLAPL